MVAVLAAFLLAWTPYAVLALIGQFGPTKIVHPYTVAAAGLLAKTSTVYNPIIYAFIDVRFRRKCAMYKVSNSTLIVFLYCLLMSLALAPSFISYSTNGRWS